MRQKRRGRLRGYPDKTRANPSGTGADPEKSSTVKTRHGLFRLAHMDDGHENGQASVLFLFSPPHRKAFHVSINRSGGSPLSSHHLQRQRDLLRVDVRPRFVCPGIGRAEAGPCELPHRRLHHENGASLAPVGSLGLRIRRNLYSAGSGASSARHHRLRIPPAMGEKELARASVSQRAVPLTHAKQRSFALETISASQKTNDPAGRQGREVHGAGDGTRTREYKLGNLFPSSSPITVFALAETIVSGETDIRAKRTKRAYPQTGW